MLVAMCVLMLNEYRLIKKYIQAIEQKENTVFQKFILVILKPLLISKNWIKNNLLNNELKYTSNEKHI
jgi:hypothetical protein